MNNKIDFTMLLNISKSIIKGLFPYFFSNYIPSKLNIDDNNVNLETNPFNNICSKTKKKLLYSLNHNNVLEYLWLLDYNKQNIEDNRYKFKVGLSSCLPKFTDKCNKRLLSLKSSSDKCYNNKTLIIAPKFKESLHGGYFYNKNYKRNKILNLKKQHKLSKEIYNFGYNKNNQFYENNINKFSKYNNIFYK